jgi:hypothetical protein
MDTGVALVNAYLRFNGYVVMPEQPILVGEGKPWRYHTATDIDIIAVRFPNAAVVVPRTRPQVERASDDLQLEVDPLLAVREGTVDVLIAEVKEGRPRLNAALREADVLYAALRRVDPGFDEAIEKAVARLIEHGEATLKAGGRKWRIRLAAFGDGEPIREGGTYTVIPLQRVMLYVMKCMEEHREVWRDVQFGDPVLDMLHLLDKLGLTRQQPRSEQEVAASGLAAERLNGARRGDGGSRSGADADAALAATAPGGTIPVTGPRPELDREEAPGEDDSIGRD